MWCHGLVYPTFTHLVPYSKSVGPVWSLVNLLLRPLALFSLGCDCGVVLHWQNSPCLCRCLPACCLEIFAKFQHLTLRVGLWNFLWICSSLLNFCPWHFGTTLYIVRPLSDIFWFLKVTTLYFVWPWSIICPSCLLSRLIGLRPASFRIQVG